MRSSTDLDQEGKQEKYRQVYIISLNPIFPWGGVFAYIFANTCTGALINLTFPNYKFGKGSTLFTPTIRLPKKKIVRNT